ncbi:MAG: prepilin peptidase [Reyranellaceae bacterium]
MAIHALLILALVCTLAWAAVNDALWFRIPNAIPIAILALFPLYLLAGGRGADQLHWALLIALATFLLGALMFARGWMGGGDVKLLAALALWAGPTHFPTFIVMTSIAGGVLVLVGLLPGRAAMISWLTLNLRIALQLPEAPRTATGRRTIPYGVAIAVGGLHLCGQLYMAGGG